MANFDAVLLDLDGTITRSEPGITNCVQYALDRMGLGEMPLEKRLKFIGPPLYESFRDLAGLGDAGARQAVEYYRERFQSVGWSENSVYPGIPGMLRALREDGVYLAVASAKPRVFVEKILSHFCLDGAFDRVEAIDLTDHHADKAELIRRALPRGCQRPAMVGDRKFDMEGAKSVGVFAAGVSYGYGGREELLRAGADAVADDAHELARLLLGRGIGPGPLITFEGCDGCGKTTQFAAAKTYIEERGYQVKLSREPGGCPISEKIRHIVLDTENAGMTPMCEALLFAAARAQHVETVIRPALALGMAVLLDRFTESSVAYQGAGRELGMEEVASINRRATGGLESDITLWFDMPPEMALARRGERDRMEDVGDDFLLRVHGAFRRMVDESPGRIRPVDARGTPEDVAQNVRTILCDFLRGRAAGAGSLYTMGG